MTRRDTRTRSSLSGAFVVLVAAMPMSLTGCGSEASGDPPADSRAGASTDVVGTWRPTRAPALGLPPEYPWDRATLTFTPTGEWSGYDGCADTDTGEYEVDGDEFDAGGESIDTGYTCRVGKDRQYVEAIDYLGVLVDVASVEREGDTLRLLDESGEVMIELAAVDT